MRHDGTLSWAARQRWERQLDRAAVKDLERQRGRTPVAAPRADFARAIAPALPVPLVVVGMAGSGLLLVATSSSSLLMIFGWLLLVLAIVSRPRAGRPVESVGTAVPGTAPETFRLLENVCTHIGAPTVHELRITSLLETSTEVVGLRRRRVLNVGAPLWASMGPEARVALLTHQVAHLKHRELVVARWTRRSLVTLQEWWLVLGGQRNIEDVNPTSERNAQSWLLQVGLSPLRAIVMAYYRLVVTSVAPLCQRGERLADLDALEAGGRAGALGMLDGLMGAGSMEVALTRARLTRTDLETALRTSLSATGAEVLEARRRPLGPGSRVDECHPSTALRYQLLECEPSVGAAVHADASQWAVIDAELAPVTRVALKESAERMSYTREPARARHRPPDWVYDA